MNKKKTVKKHESDAEISKSGKKNGKKEHNIDNVNNVNNGNIMNIGNSGNNGNNGNNGNTKSNFGNFKNEEKLSQKIKISKNTAQSNQLQNQDKSTGMLHKTTGSIKISSINDPNNKEKEKVKSMKRSVSASFFKK